jgi:uncharacterized membrane protein
MDERPNVFPSVGGHPVEVWIAQVLRVGVTVASAVILLGLLLSLFGARPAGPHPALGNMTGHTVTVVTPTSLRHGLARGDPVSILQLGLLLLILTPVVRVAMTAVLFAAQRDWTFVLLTASVLALLLLGLAGIG